MNTRLLDDFISLLYPNNCVICHDLLLKEENHFCVSCFLSLERILPGSGHADNLSGKFALYPQVIFTTSYMCFKANGAAGKLVHSFKYDGNDKLAFYMGGLLAREREEAINRNLWHGILPVPLHVKRLKSRGYNQSKLIAEGMQSILNLPVLDNQIRRCKSTMTQTGKTRFDRWKSMSQIYELHPDFDLEGESVLVVDDVITTGATMCGLLELLIAAGVDKIGVVSIANEA